MDLRNGTIPRTAVAAVLVLSAVPGVARAELPADAAGLLGRSCSDARAALEASGLRTRELTEPPRLGSPASGMTVSEIEVDSTSLSLFCEAGRVAGLFAARTYGQPVFGSVIRGFDPFDGVARARERLGEPIEASGEGGPSGGGLWLVGRVLVVYQHCLGC